MATAPRKRAGTARTASSTTSEPDVTREPSAESEPTRTNEPETKSEPTPTSAPETPSEPPERSEPITQSELTKTQRTLVLHPEASLAQLAALTELRQPFPERLIGKKPINVAKEGAKAECDVCHGYHRWATGHLDFVGHAAVTDRLLDADPYWTWEPADLPNLPMPVGGLWIKLTVAGVSRLGFGYAPLKDRNDNEATGNQVKEAIGDALRNAAMRFGVGLNLWHKGDFFEVDHGDAVARESAPPTTQAPDPQDTQRQRQAGEELQAAMSDQEQARERLTAIVNEKGQSMAAVAKELCEEYELQYASQATADQIDRYIARHAQWW